MIDKRDKPVCVQKLVFNEDNHKQKSLKVLGSTCKFSLLIFLSTLSAIVLMLENATV